MADTANPSAAPSGAWREPTRPGSSGAAGREPGRPEPREGPRAPDLPTRPALVLAIPRRTDESIVELWRGGVRGEREIGRRIGLDQRSVSRHICRMLRTGTWPFGDRPTRGRVRAPVAPGFVAIPIRTGPARPDRPRSATTAAPASA